MVLAILLVTLKSSAPLRSAEPRKWPVETSIGPFKIHADFQLESKQALRSELEDTSIDVERLLGLEVNQRPIHIVLFKTSHEYKRYMNNYFPSLPSRRALYIQHHGPGMLFTHWHEDVGTDLRHEVTHALLNSGEQSLPLWIDEGLAEYFEVLSQDRFLGNPYMAEVISRSKQGFVPSIERLEAIDDLAEFSDSHYRDSWSWLHFLLHRDSKTRSLVSDYVRRNRHGDPQLPLSRLLTEILPNANQEYREHFESLESKRLAN